MLLVNGGAATSAAAVAIPALVSALSPVIQRRGGEDWRAAGPLEDFPVREVHQAIVTAAEDNWPPAFEPLAVFVWRASETEVIVYSRNCTDLQCPLNYDAGSSCFFCPCHGGIFATDGERMAGPPSRPMYRYAVRVRDGILEIDVNSLPSAG
jgi:menaquinol-cytochrome c reductase iron-sulfur subunit